MERKELLVSIVLLFIVSQSSFAQLHVDSLGHVGVGVTTPLVSNFAVGKAGSIYYNAHVTGPGSGVYGEFKTLVVAQHTRLGLVYTAMEYQMVLPM